MSLSHSRRVRRMCMLLTAVMLLPLPACGHATGDAQPIYDVSEPSGAYSALSDEQKSEIPLINAWNPLPGEFSLPETAGRAQGAYDVLGGFSNLVNLYEQRHSFRLAASDIWLCRHVYEAMERMFAAAEAEDMNGFIITSGYRSRARQQEIYDETEPGLAAQPGCSEHETGLSFDVTAYSDSGDFASTPQYEWLIRNCWDYGFILRYPDGTSDITGILGESWHFRYVGEDAAREILARQVTLEEYLSGVQPRAVSADALWAAQGGGQGGASGQAFATMRPAQGVTAQPEVSPAPATTPTPAPTGTIAPVTTVSPTEAAVFDTIMLEGEDMEFIDPTYVRKEGTEVIYLAGGCFWGMEKLMQSLDGVLTVTSGYANGSVSAPGYRQVCAGDTGHRETVRVEYDPEAITLDELLWAYFEVIDPELVNRQGHDVGTQYQAGIYYVDAATRDVVERAAEEKRGQYAHFAVEIEPLTCFYDAEEYHQDYLDKNPGGYCHIPLADIRRVSEELNG